MLQRDKAPMKSTYGINGHKAKGYKEFELGAQQDNQVFSRKALWNGGAGASWMTVQETIRGRFTAKGLGEFLTRRVDPPEQLLDTEMDNYVTAQLAPLTTEI